MTTSSCTSARVFTTKSSNSLETLASLKRKIASWDKKAASPEILWRYHVDVKRINISRRGNTTIKSDLKAKL